MCASKCCCELVYRVVAQAAITICCGVCFATAIVLFSSERLIVTACEEPFITVTGWLGNGRPPSPRIYINK